MTAINTAVIYTGDRRSSRVTAAAAQTTATDYADILWNGTNNEGGTPPAAGVTTTAWLDKGTASIVTLDGTWVTSSSTPLTVKVFGTNDLNGTVIVPLPYIPSSASGATPAYPQETSFTKSDWGNAATNYVGGVILASGWRYLKVQFKGGDTSGTFLPGATAWA